MIRKRIEKASALVHDGEEKRLGAVMASGILPTFLSCEFN